MNSSFSYELGLLCSPRLNIGREEVYRLVESLKDHLVHSGNRCQEYVHTFITYMYSYAIKRKPITDWVRELFDVVFHLPCRQHVVKYINSYVEDTIFVPKKYRVIWIHFINDILDEYRHRAELNEILPIALHDMHHHTIFGVKDLNDIINSYTNQPNLDMEEIKEIYPRRTAIRRRSPVNLPSELKNRRRSRSPRSRRIRKQSPRKNYDYMSIYDETAQEILFLRNLLSKNV